MEQGFSWETAASFVSVMGAIVAFLTAWYRYKSSTPLERLFMEGADRVLIQVGAVVDYIGIVIFWTAVMNVSGLWISSTLLSNMLNEKLKEMLKADSPDIYSRIFAMLGLLFLLIWTQTFRLKSDSNDYHMDKKTMRLAEKSDATEFNNQVKAVITIIAEILAIVILFYLIRDNFINQVSAFFLIKITLDLVSDIFLRIGCRWILKLTGMYTVEVSSLIGIIMCVLDEIYLCFVTNKPYNNRIDPFLAIFYVSIASYFTFTTMNANELKDSNSELLREFKIRYITFSLVVFGVVVVPYSLMHNGLDMSNIMACIMGNDKSSLSVNMNTIMILLVEMVVMLLSLGGMKSIKVSMNFQEVKLRLVNLSIGKPWFAYRVCDGQLLCGKDREYKNQSSSHFIPMADIYAGKYALMDADIEPQEFYSVKVLLKGRAESNIDCVIDVSTKKARRDKEYNFIMGSLFDDLLGESGTVNISLIKDRLSNKLIDKNSRILVYGEEERLQVAAWRLIDMGYKSVYICKARKYCQWSLDGKTLCAEFVLRK